MQPDTAISMKLQRISSFLRIIQISKHHTRTGKTYLPILTKWKLFGRPWFANRIISVRIRIPNASLLLLVVRGQTACSDALGSAIAFTHNNGGVMIGKKLVQFFLEFDRKGIATREYSHQT